MYKFVIITNVNIMKSYLEVAGLILSMSVDEVNILKKYITSFDKTKKEKESKYIILINHIIHEQGEKENEIFYQLYPNKELKPFRALCYRLRDKALESLILEVNVNRKNQLTPYGRAFIRVNKMIMELRLCFTRGQEELGMKLIEKVIVTGGKYGFYDEVIQVLYIKQKVVNVKYGSKKERKLAEKIEYYELLRDSLLLANKYIDRLHGETAFKKSKSKKITYYEKAIQDIEKRVKQASSKELYYQLQWMKMQYSQEQKDYKQSLYYASNLLSYILAEPFVYKHIRKGTILLNIAHNKIFTGQIETALADADLAIEYLPKYTHNYYLLQEVRFHIMYYSNKGEDALALAQKMCLDEHPDKTDFQEDKWHYWLAVCLFNNKQFAAAQKELEKVQELRRDTEGWNLSIRILNIICSISLGLEQKTERQIQALKRQYNRRPNIQVRLKTILSILLSLEGELNFKSVYKEHQLAFDKLEKRKGWYKWDVKTPELFLFDQWFLSMMDDEKEYSPNYKELLSDE